MHCPFCGCTPGVPCTKWSVRGGLSSSWGQTTHNELYWRFAWQRCLFSERNATYGLCLLLPDSTSPPPLPAPKDSLQSLSLIWFYFPPNKFVELWGCRVLGFSCTHSVLGAARHMPCCYQEFSPEPAILEFLAPIKTMVDPI